MMGKVLKKRYTVYSQRVGAINSKKKTPKTRKRTSREHPEVTGVPFRHVAYVAAAAMFAAVPEPVASIHGACCDSQESGWNKNSANRHYHLKSGTFHKHFTKSKETFGEFGFEFHTWKCLSSRWIFRIQGLQTWPPTRYRVTCGFPCGPSTLRRLLSEDAEVDSVKDEKGWTWQ